MAHVVTILLLHVKNGAHGVAVFLAASLQQTSQRLPKVTKLTGTSHV